MSQQNQKVLNFSAKELRDDEPSDSKSTGSSSCSDLAPTTCFICSKQFGDDQAFQKHMQHRHPSASMPPLSVKSHHVTADWMETTKKPATFTTLNRRRVCYKNDIFKNSSSISRDKKHQNWRKDEPRSFFSKVDQTLEGNAPDNSKSSEEATGVNSKSPQPNINPLLQLVSPSISSTRDTIEKYDLPVFKVVRITFEVDKNGVFPDDAIFMDNPGCSPRPGDCLLDLSDEADATQPFLRTIDGQEGRLPSRALLTKLELPWGLPESLPLNPRGIHMEIAVLKRNLSTSQGGGIAFSRNEVVLILKHNDANIVVMDYDGQVGNVKLWDLNIRSTQIAPPWGLLVDVEAWVVILKTLTKGLQTVSSIF